MAVRLFFPYDGSPHGRWVFRYAMRMARQLSDRTVHVIHAQTTEVTDNELSVARAQLEAESSVIGIHVAWATVASHTSVHDALEQSIPDDRESLVVCGTRSGGGRTRYLSGTVSERFLTQGQRQVVVIRVNNPGLLGVPQHVLIPISDRHPSAGNSLPIVRLLGPDIHAVHVLLVQTAAGPWHGLLPNIWTPEVRPGIELLEQTERALRGLLPVTSVAMDGVVRQAQDFAAAVVQHANRVHARLILLGSPSSHRWSRHFTRDPLERVLRSANCDVAIYRDYP